MEIVLAKAKRERDILWFFDLALLLKAIDGGLEVLVAFLVLITPPSFVLTMTTLVTGGELAQDPGDPIANAINNAAHSFAIHTHYLLALYLMLHGAIKIVLVVGIFSGKKIFYPLFMTALVIFGTYEVYRGFIRQETLLQVLAIFDFSLLILTAYEYRRRYPRLPHNSFSLGT